MPGKQKEEDKKGKPQPYSFPDGKKSLLSSIEIGLLIHYNFWEIKIVPLALKSFSHFYVQWVEKDKTHFATKFILASCVLS